MKILCKKCNCAFDIRTVPEYISGYGDPIAICPECRTPLDMIDENFIWEDNEEWEEDF